MLRRLLFCLFTLLLVNSGLLYGQRVNGNFLIKLKPQVTPVDFISNFATQTRSGGGVWLERNLSDRGNIHLLQYDTTSVEKEILVSELMTDPYVEHVMLDYYLEQRSLPNDPNVREQWGLDKIMAQEAWDITTGGVTANGDTIVVAILDSGFDISHQDLQPNIWVNHFEIPGDGLDNDQNGFIDDLHGWNFIEDSPEHIPDAHGNSVAGIIGAKGNNGIGISGINWNVKLMVFETRMVSDIIAAYEYIIDQRDRYNRTKGQQGAFVVATNASFGINKLFCTSQPLWGEMYDRLGTAGVLTAAGTANNAWNVDEEGDMPTTCNSPYLLTVLNTDHNDQRYLGSAFGQQSIDMGVPGQNSYTTKTYDLYGAFHGNSAAAPHLAGAIALLYSLPNSNLAEKAIKYPEATALQVRDALLHSVDPVPALMDLTQTGGRLNLFHSLHELMEHYPVNVTTSTKTILLDPSAVIISPNPASDQIQLTFSKEQQSQECIIAIYDAFGNLIQRHQLQPAQLPGNSLKLNSSNWPVGTYFTNIYMDTGMLSKKIVIVR